jgi:hypothetical protein
MVVGLVGVWGGGVGGGVLWDGAAASAAGAAPAARGDQPGAVAAWRRAAAWSVPLAPHVATAHARLGGEIVSVRASGSPGWMLLALIGLALWLGGAILFARRGLDDAERWIARDAGAAAVLVTFGLVAWMAGLYGA